MRKKNIQFEGSPHWKSIHIKSLSDVIFIENLIISDIEEIELISQQHQDIFIDRDNFIDFFKKIFIFVEKKEKEITKQLSFLHFYSLTGSDNNIKEAIEKTLNKINTYLSEKIYYNKKLYLIFKKLYDFIILDESVVASYIDDTEFVLETKKTISDKIKNYERSGINYSEEIQSRLKEINIEMQCLMHRYQLNIQKTKNHIIVEKIALTGLTNDQLKKLIYLNDGTYKIGVDYPTVSLIMSYCSNREVRKLLYYQVEKVAFPENESLLNNFRILAQEKAQLLRYEDYPTYDIEKSMAKTVENVEKMFQDIFKTTYEKANEEKNTLIEFSKRQFADSFMNEIYPWDTEYVYQMYKNKCFSIDEEYVAQHFPVTYTVEKIFEIYEKFFDIEIKFLNYSDNSWKIDDEMFIVRVFKSGKILGDLIFDLYPRDDKYKHACFASIITPTYSLINHDKKQLDEIPVGAVIANFSKPVDGHDGLLFFNEVKTFFHELGHALHDLFGATYYRENAGTNVDYDFVEVPSQLLEQWFLQPSILKMVSSHYLTKEPLSDDLIDKIIDVKFYNIGLFYQRQLYLSLFSLYLYKYPFEEVSSIRERISKKLVFLSKLDIQTSSHCSFGHLMSDNYGSKYYVYLWALMYAIEFFVYIKKQNGFLNKEIGEKMFKKVLSKGGSIDPTILIIDFLEKEPDPLSNFSLYINRYI